MSEVPAAPARAGGGVHVGRLVFGLAVAALGILWLLQALDVATIDWRYGLPIAVIAVGIALVVVGLAGRGSSGLVMLGIALTVLLVASTVVDIPLGAGVGDRSYRPSVLENRSYELAVGQLTVDLTRAARPDQDRTVRAHVGVGKLVVVLPPASGLDVRTEVGIGGSDVFGVSKGGFDVRYGIGGSTTGSVVYVDLSVGVGQVEVRRG
jgi:Cell wall-active antibiotics response 4TMS YvqF